MKVFFHFSRMKTRLVETHVHRESKTKAIVCWKMKTRKICLLHGTPNSLSTRDF